MYLKKISYLLELPLKYPAFNSRIKTENGKPFIFDFVRKKWLLLSPEEWVRQHVLNFLVSEKKYPVSSIAIEKELRLNGLKKRYDIVVYNNRLEPVLIVECKAPYIALDKAVVEQALRYNLVVRAQMIMVSNGVSDFVFNLDNEQIQLPDYNNDWFFGNKKSPPDGGPEFYS